MGRGHVHFAVGVPASTSSSVTVTSGSSGTKIFPAPLSDTHKDVDANTGAIDDDADGGEKAVKASPDAAPIISGMRASASVLVWVDVRRSMSEGGIKWWRAANGVVLSEGDGRGFVPLRFVRRAEARARGEEEVEFLWRNEEELGLAGVVG